jgi:hypothetical protein
VRQAREIARFLLAAHGSNRDRWPKGRMASIIAPARKQWRQKNSAPDIAGALV